MNHKVNCQCCICKAKRGEYKGENHPLFGIKGKNSSHWLGNKAKTRQIHYCIDNCGKEVSKDGNRCRSCASKKKWNIFENKIKWGKNRRGKNNPNYNNRGIKSKLYKPENHIQYYCIENNCNNKVNKNGNRCLFCAAKKRRKDNPNMLKGSNNPSWKGGISKEPYGLEFNNKLKEKIRKRDNYICQNCNKSQTKFKEKLHNHHIDYNKRNNNINNLISLCRSCHVKTNFNRDYWYAYFKYIKIWKIKKI